MLPTYMANNYHGYFTKEQEDQFWNEVQQAHDDREKALNDEEFKLKDKELQQKLGVAFTALTEMMITKAILLNKNVTVILNELIENIGTDPSPLDYEEPDDYGYRVKDAIDTALEKIRCSALSDLEIRHLESNIPTWGVGGRRFKSSRADQKSRETSLKRLVFMPAFARGVSGVKRGENPINNNYSGVIFLPKKSSIFCLLYFQNDYWR